MRIYGIGPHSEFDLKVHRLDPEVPETGPRGAGGPPRPRPPPPDRDGA